MFQNLRKGAPFYILYKNDLCVKIGEVDEVGAPVPQFGPTYNNGVLTPPRSLIEIKVLMDGETITLQALPAEASIADFKNGMVVSESKEAILSEVEAMEKSSEKALADRPRHEKTIAACRDMKVLLNPQIAKEEEQAREIEGLKSEISELKGLLIKALGKKDKEKE